MLTVDFFIIITHTLTMFYFKETPTDLFLINTNLYNFLYINYPTEDMLQLASEIATDLYRYCEDDTNYNISFEEQCKQIDEIKKNPNCIIHMTSSKITKILLKLRLDEVFNDIYDKEL